MRTSTARITRESVGYRPIARSKLIAMVAAVLSAGAIFGFAGWFAPAVVVTCGRTAIGAPAQCTLTEQGRFNPMQSTDFLLDGARIERVVVAPGRLRGDWSRLRITTTTAGPLALPEYEVNGGEHAVLLDGLRAFQADARAMSYEGGYDARYLSWAGAVFVAVGMLAVALYVARKGTRESFAPQ